VTVIIIDTLLAKREADNRPIQVGLVGAGYMGRGIALQVLTATKGMRLAAVANRTLDNAARAYRQGGVDTFDTCDTTSQIESAIAAGRYVITENALGMCRAENVDVIIEVTGTIDYAARVCLEAIDHGTHVVLMNAELDATLGPVLSAKARRRGVVLTNSDGDQPGVIMNLFRFVASIGCRPVLAGNMKGLQDPYRTPETQKAYAAKFKQKPPMVTSFADGTKISMEMAVIANATGFKVGQRGMYGPECKHVTEAAKLFPREQMLQNGLVDYVLGAEPGPGVFVIGYNDNPLQQQYLNYYKMGDGPFYVFYTPYHLCHLESPLTAARAVLCQDAATIPLNGPVCEVITLAKRDLKAGEILDGIGGFTSYGVLDNIEVTAPVGLLPMGLSEGCRLKRAVTKDQPIAYSDVEIPADRDCDRLRQEQNTLFN
jgi:predicted homoserine dehydrogenase-like protein